jgi:hypothetical protein
MAWFMHQKVMKAIKAIMGVVWYVAIGCDEVSIVDNQFLFLSIVM